MELVYLALIGLFAGLVKGTVDGKKSCYCIHWENFNKFSSAIGGWFKDLHIQSCNCC